MNEWYEVFLDDVLKWFLNLLWVVVMIWNLSFVECYKWVVYLCFSDGVFFLRIYYFYNVVDWVGIGDVFVVGLIYGLVMNMFDEIVLQFGVVVNVLKYIIVGDINMVMVVEVKVLMESDGMVWLCWQSVMVGVRGLIMKIDIFNLWLSCRDFGGLLFGGLFVVVGCNDIFSGGVCVLYLIDL